MMGRAVGVTAFGAAVLACAAALGAHPVDRRPAAGSMVKRYESVSVLRYGARAGDGRDDSRAFQLAVDSARLVHVPAGVFHVDRTVLLPSDTRVRGAGAASELVARAALKYLFFSHQTTDVTVENLSFRDPSPDSVYAFWPRFVRRARFEGNRVEGMGLIVADNSTGVQVLRNRGHGGAGSKIKAVDISFSRQVTVKRNEVRDFLTGIQWWGRFPPNPRRLTGEIVIDSNTVANVGVGIWGAYGEHITVTGNDVAVCADLCLDAEASRDVRFTGNNARFGGTAVLGVYFDASDVVFERNTVVQDGRPHGDRRAAVSSPEEAWCRMLWIPNDEAPRAALSTRLRGNRFTFTGPRNRQGTLQKQRTNRVEIEGNFLVNTVIQMSEGDQGTLSITDNEFTLDYADERPAIDVGDSHDMMGRPGTLTVRGNRIRTRGERFPPDLPAIRVRQRSRRGAVRSVVEGNTITGFSTSVAYGGEGSNHLFRIVGNRHDGALTVRGRAAGAEVRDNRMP